jgi:crotonobetainyl-CoA:carnitine CoA-transferase CaiB-like acyl-CoA transferase
MKTEKKFDAVKMAREIKDKLDAKLSKMTTEEIVAYFREQRMKSNRVNHSV